MNTNHQKMKTKDYFNFDLGKNYYRELANFDFFILFVVPQKV